MPEITDEELAEYFMLKRHYGQDAIQESLSQLVSLEDDIDLPIKKCVMAFALLGCEPVWSCCGFDYQGQPFHKSHQYGRTYFILENERALPICRQFNLGWRLYLEGKHLDFHVDFQNVIPQWHRPDSPHFHEPAVVHIQALENYLLSKASEFSDEITLADTNGEYKYRYVYWQYPVLQPWTIHKSDLLGE